MECTKCGKGLNAEFTQCPQCDLGLCEHGNYHCGICERRLLLQTVHEMSERMIEMINSFERIEQLTRFYDEAVKDEVHDIASRFFIKG